MGTIDFDLKVKVFSFDIFDTVLTRSLSKPVDVFSLLGDRLRKEGIRVPPFGLFRLLRTRCERWSRRFEPSYEVRLPDVHSLLGKFLLWSEKDQLRAAELEREIEASVLRITPHGKKAVEDARTTGARIAYVSDMYLEEDFLRSILEREGLFEDGDLLAVSGEWKASKAGGTIWPRLIETLGVDPVDILHQGDNPHSDIESPRKAGIPASRLGTAEASRWEVWTGPQHGAGVAEHGGIAALSRMARARCGNPDDYWTMLGAGFLGPILAGFTAWLLEDASRRGIGTLWFLSRDGWLFLESARHLAGQAGPKLEYFCAGRRQLLHAVPDVVPISPEELFQGSRCHSLRLVASRLALGETDVAKLQEALGLSGGNPEQNLDEAAKRGLLNLLTSDPWRQRLTVARRDAGNPVRDYLEQMKDRSTGRVGLVDVGWVGRSQDHLMNLLPEVGPLQGYYLGYSGSATSGDSKLGWLYDRSRGEGTMSLHDHQRLLEVLVGGVSGPLLGYDRGKDGISPVFAEMENGESAPGRQLAQQAALEFVRLAADPLFRDWWSVEALRRFSGRNLDQLLLEPTEEDARKFVEWTVTTDDAHLDRVGLAKGYDSKRILSCLKRHEPWAFLWPAAALRNSNPLGGLFMRLAWLARRSRN